MNFQPVRPNTIAKSLAIGNPADGYYALQVMEETGGAGVASSDEEIVEGIKLLAETEGIFAETAGGVVTSASSSWRRRARSAPTRWWSPSSPAPAEDAGGGGRGRPATAAREADWSSFEAAAGDVFARRWPDGREKRVRFTFPAELIQEPVIYLLGHQFEVITNVRMADVEEDSAGSSSSSRARKTRSSGRSPGPVVERVLRAGPDYRGRSRGVGGGRVSPETLVLEGAG